MKRSGKFIGLACLLGVLTFSACGTDSGISEAETDAFYSDTNPDSETSGSAEITENKIPEDEKEIPANTASKEELQRLIDQVEFPEINITGDSTPEEIMLAGKTAGMFYGKAAEEFFGYHCGMKWKTDNNDELSLNGALSFEAQRCLGLYTDRENDIYVPMNYDEIKHFMMSYIGLTEWGFSNLCKNSPSTYLGIAHVPESHIINNDEYACYMYQGDGGEAGWSYSYIIDYEMNGAGDIVTYNCARVGDMKEWDFYEKDMVKPFTFQLVYEDGRWLLNDVSCGEGLWMDFIGLESDVEEWKINLENSLAGES